MNKNRIKIFSFFAGCGILDLGFENNGYEIVFVNEYFAPFMEAYKSARKNLEKPVPEFGYHECDINDFLTDTEGLAETIKTAKQDGSLVGFIGGPPCPDFSIAGKNRGKHGDNGRLSLSYIKLVIATKPDFFLFENVKGLWQTTRHREFYESLKRKLHNAGYATTERLTNALEFGVPQDRERILLFGINKDHLGTRKNELSSFKWEEHISENLAEVKNLPWPDTSPFITEGSLGCPVGILEHLTVEYWFKKNEVEKHPNSTNHFIPRGGLARFEVVEEGDVSRKSYKRLHRWRYAPTAAYGNNEVHLHPYFPRRLSAAEAMAIQTLPSYFILPPDMTLTNMFKTIGNGVPYLLSEGIAKTIRSFIKAEIWEK
jgi:DNA (cytosine-5)-methyltransferase 1